MAAAAFDVEKGDQPMVTGYAGAILAVAGPCVLAVRIPATETLAFERALEAWLFVLAAALIAVDYAARRKVLGLLAGPPVPARRLIAPSLARWLGWSAILALGWLVYTTIEYYSTDHFARFRSLVRTCGLAWAAGGIPYYLVTLRRRRGVSWDRADAGLLVVLIATRCAREIGCRRSPWAALSRLLCARSALVVWRGLAVKAFFLPFIVTVYVSLAGQTATALRSTIAWMETSGGSPDIDKAANVLFPLLHNALFLIDVSLATLGYAITNRWLDNGMRSVEPTALGWIACLACYRPFALVVGWYFVWPEASLVEIADGPLKLCLMAAVLILTGIYVWSTLAFGLSFSNLTNRGIFTRGPYRWVRHPAYASKNLSWWFQYAPSLTSVRAVVFLVVWNLIYYVRVVTEERHLSQDPKYLAYKKRVRWRLIPGLF